MAREVIGTCSCPECGGAAEVKRTKAGLAYRWCLDCHAQYFPRTAEASDRLIAKCGGAKTAPTVTAPAPAPAPAKPKAKAAPKPPEAKPEPAPAPAPATTPTPAKPRSPFDDALAFLGGRT